MTMPYTQAHVEAGEAAPGVRRYQPGIGAASGAVAELERALALGRRERNTVKRVLDVELSALARTASSAGADWDAFATDHRDALERGRELLTRHSRGR